jgi:hypothetical protein
MCVELMHGVEPASPSFCYMWQTASCCVKNFPQYLIEICYWTICLRRVSVILAHVGLL